jgi:hypothetical protein
MLERPLPEAARDHFAVDVQRSEQLARQDRALFNAVFAIAEVRK